ncbi:hypothetical protein RI103_06115 [Paraburkholderia sp. FT54]|uniref:hypothetical protein n=1 Tax=Paraburkholderia sp. FT54 TaxID=3074437 RepID=UPI002877D69A|nr:hypothetical protein [Paraburkholderia sp. FT54]WNC90922.1 hypothetical protein RI103_06115 [Paraburkholderia sp. FT54]
MTSDNVNWDEVAPHVRHRRCPGCNAELSRFHLNALLMPIEQFSIGRLQQVNNLMGWSIRPFGLQSISELQLLVFVSPCENCSLLSTWDFGTEELNEIFGPHGQPPYAQIAWNYSPDLIERHLGSAPDWLKPNLQQLLDAIRPKPHDQAKS